MIEVLAVIGGVSAIAGWGLLAVLMYNVNKSTKEREAKESNNAKIKSKQRKL